MPSCLLSCLISALACFMVDICGSALMSPSSLANATCMPSSTLMSSMHWSTTWYHWTRSVSAGTSDGRKSRPSVSSSHLAER